MSEETYAITEVDVDNLAKSFEAAIPRDAVLRDASDAFCEAWPAVKDGLSVLRSVLDFVPGVGAFAKAAIAIVTASGDAAQKAFCK